MLQINYYIVPLIIGILLSAFFIIYIIKTKPTFNYKLLIVLSAGSMWWLLCTLLDVINTDVATKIFWNHLSFIGVVTVTLSFFIFTGQYSMGKKWVTNKNVLALSIFPAIFLIFNFTNQYHWLVVSEYQTVIINNNVFLTKTYGPVFWAWTVYAYLFVIIGFYLLIKMLIISLRYYKWYSLTLIVATMIPIFANIAYLAEILPIKHYDPTPVGLIISIVILLYGITRLKIGDLMPFTRESLVENMKDGIILLNSEEKIIDYNSVADSLVGNNDNDNLRGKDINDVLPAYKDYLQEEKENGMEYRKSILEDTDSSKLYEVYINPFYDYRKKITSNLLTFRDVTERKIAEEKIMFLSFHDKLTGLYNRAYFEEELERLDNPRMLPLSVIIGDVNGLKLVNDAFGHREGDRLLIKTASILRKTCRTYDILSRWGGDEFALLLPKTNKKVADNIALRVKHACEETKDQKIPLSISLGVFTKNEEVQDINEVIRKAEDWMYKGKLLEKKSISNSIISSLEKTLQEKSHETRRHADRLKHWAVKIGNRMKLPQNKIDELILLSSLHDIGKIVIPDEILNKKEKLTEEDWRLIKKHPETGHNIAEATSQLSPIAEAILSHHEWWDGNGYPYGIKGREIPITARIISVVDTYDVICNGRTYKEARDSQSAINEIERNSGKQFDPGIVRIFLELVKQEAVSSYSK